MCMLDICMSVFMYVFTRTGTLCLKFETFLENLGRRLLSGDVPPPSKMLSALEEQAGFRGLRVEGVGLRI